MGELALYPITGCFDLLGQEIEATAKVIQDGNKEGPDSRKTLEEAEAKRGTEATHLCGNTVQDRRNAPAQRLDSDCKPVQEQAHLGSQPGKGSAEPEENCGNLGTCKAQRSHETGEQTPEVSPQPCEEGLRFESKGFDEAAQDTKSGDHPLLGSV